MYSTSPGFGLALEARCTGEADANEYPVITQGFGITPVLTDVILTPDGQVSLAAN